MKIQALTEKDHPQIMQVWENAVRATHDFLKEEDIQTYRQLLLDKYLAMVDLYGICQEERHLVGFIGLSVDVIQMLFIDATVRGKGIGKQLIQFAIQKKGARLVDVNEQNQQALGFYEHMGFTTVHRSPIDDAGKPYPILTMRLRRKFGFRLQWPKV